MNQVEKLQKMYEKGLVILEEFMKMSDKEIKEKLRSIAGNKIPDADYILGEQGHVRRVIENEKPSEITLSFYDTIKISPFGITFEGEHGYRNKDLVDFNEHFKL